MLNHCTVFIKELGDYSFQRLVELGLLRPSPAPCVVETVTLLMAVVSCAGVMPDPSAACMAHDPPSDCPPWALTSGVCLCLAVTPSESVQPGTNTGAFSSHKSQVQITIPLRNTAMVAGEILKCNEKPFPH